MNHGWCGCTFKVIPHQPRIGNVRTQKVVLYESRTLTCTNYNLCTNCMIGTNVEYESSNDFFVSSEREGAGDTLLFVFFVLV